MKRKKEAFMAVYHELANGKILTQEEFENYEFKAENNVDFLRTLMVEALPPKRSYLDTREDKLKSELARLEQKRLEQKRLEQKRSGRCT